LRYRFISYKYSRKVSQDAALRNIWEAFSPWAGPSASIWRPPTDVYETPEELIVIIELAGVEEDEMSVTLFSDLLVVEGRREQPLFIGMNACHQLGIKYGDFRSEIHIPLAVDSNEVNAEYRNGLLIISLKKSF